MTLANNADVALGGVYFKLDQGYIDETGRRCYVHGGRSIFAGRTDITGKPGAQNLKEDYLVWSLTRFDGEGQVVLDPADPDSQFRFYRSEGLDMRVAGEMKLNKSVISETVTVSAGANTTAQGAADFEDVSGTASTTTNTDRKLTAVNTKVGMSANYTPGLTTNQVEFYLYRESFSSYATTIQGNDFIKLDGSPTNSGGSDKILTRGDVVWSAKLSTGSELTADQLTRVEVYASIPGLRGPLVRCQVVEVTGANDNVIAGGLFAPEGTPMAALTFTPKTGKAYRVKFGYPAGQEPSPVQVTLDKILYGSDPGANTATIEVWNQSAGSSVTSSVVSVDTESTPGGEAGAKVGTITFAAAAATNYRARVTRTSGQQRIWLDKVILKPLANAVYSIDCLDLGLGSQTNGVFTPQVWAAARATAVDPAGFVYNTSTDAWDLTATNDTATGTNLACRAMAHSDSAEYFLYDSGEVVSSTAAGTDTLRVTTITGPVGMTVAQNRLFILAEGSAGVTVYSCPLDTTVGNITTGTGVLSNNFETGSKSPDTSLRQRMCTSPTGARFFVNFGDVTTKVYQADISDGTMIVTELADLGTGIKATSICYESGLTFVGCQYYGDSTASDTDKKPRAALFVIDQNGIQQRIGFMRFDSPDVRPPQFMVPYQTNLYILQGVYVWRYDLVNGGLYLEYELTPQTAGNQKALTVLLGRVFAAYSDEIFVAGSVGTYRQSSVSGGNMFTSSIFDFGLPAVKKALAKIDVLTDTLAASTSVTIEYQIDQSGTWVQAGTMSTGRQQTFYIQGVSFTTLQVRARLATANGTSTPVLHAVTIWASAADDEEYFDLVFRTEDQDSSDRIQGEQATGQEKANALMQIWRQKQVTTLTDGYTYNEQRTVPGEDYLGTIEDLRVEQNKTGEGRVVVTFRVVR